MRFLIRLLVLAVILFCAWWALASYGASQAITTWIDDRRAEGWQIEAKTAQRGFPFNIRTQLLDVAVTDADQLTSVQLQGAAVSARTYWPGYVDIELPQTPVIFQDSAARTSVQTTDGTLALRLRPGFALELDRVGLDSDAWTFRSGQTTVLSGAALAGHATQTGDDRARYDLRLSADALAPGDLIRQVLGLPATWPQSFDSFAATGAVTFDAPLTRDSFEGEKPQFRQITLSDATVVWGAVSLNANGALDVDAAGVPTGSVTVQAKDWRGLLDIAEQSGMLPARQRGQTELMLSLLANRSGDAANLDIDIAFANGAMSVSGIPLGAAPKLLLR